MKIEIRHANEEDFSWLCEVDKAAPRSWVARTIFHGEYLIALLDGEKRGFLRYSLFWGKVPCMDVLLIDEGFRRQGVGTVLVKEWQGEMIRKGAKILMTSAMESEPEPQAWHRRNGFRESGQLTFAGVQPTPEIFFIKELSF